MGLRSALGGISFRPKDPKTVLSGGLRRRKDLPTPKKTGTAIGDYDITREAIADAEAGKLQVSYDPNLLTPPTLLADEKSIKKAKKKKLGVQQRRAGRASTILSETLG